MSADDVMKAVQIGVERVRQVDEVVVKALAQDRSRRVVEVR